jgi:hypothetical protein
VRKLSPAILFFLAAVVAHAQWNVVSAEFEPGAARGLEHRYLVLEDPASGDRVSMELALFPARSFKLRVIDQLSEPRVELSEAMRRENCLAGVNGGYFDPDYNPIGLLIADGKTVAPFQRARLLSGVLTASGNKVQLLRVGEFSREQKLNAAVECGPMIVDLGNRVHGLEATRLARRTFAAVTTGDRVALGFCSNVTLADLSKVLTTQLAADLKIQRALNLDGGSSSAFWFKRRDGSAFSISEEKDVRDFVAIVPR